MIIYYFYFKKKRQKKFKMMIVSQATTLQSMFIKWVGFYSWAEKERQVPPSLAKSPLYSI
jgi:hypothetical protein